MLQVREVFAVVLCIDVYFHFLAIHVDDGDDARNGVVALSYAEGPRRCFVLLSGFEWPGRPEFVWIGNGCFDAVAHFVEGIPNYFHVFRLSLLRG